MRRGDLKGEFLHFQGRLHFEERDGSIRSSFLLFFFMFVRLISWILRLLVLAVVVFLIYQFIIVPFMVAKAKVLHVFDADSLLVMQNGEIRRVQLIGVDAPEHAGPKGDIHECFADEATWVAADFFKHEREVRLDGDSGVGETDVHGRDLKYVSLEDGQVLNEVLLQEGVAREFHLDEQDYARRSEFESLEKGARAEERGLWSNCGA